jgi:SNF2-related domain/Restriction endonuclease/Helicase conserved C-terminal domain
MVDWIKTKMRTQSGHVARGLSRDGVVIVKDSSALPADAAQTTEFLSVGDVDDLLHQLHDDGYADAQQDGYLIPWEAIYGLLENTDYASSVPLLAIPNVGSFYPTLESHGSLIDKEFSITIVNWRDGAGHRIGPVQLTGAVIRHGDDTQLLPGPAWQLVRSVNAFFLRDEGMRNAEAHRRAWGEIRKIALNANARLDDFLRRTVVLTPERLKIGLSKNDIGGMKVIEVEPGFIGAPKEWLTTFDALKVVPNRYDIPTPEGIVQVLINPQVKTVLQQLKRMPGRRVAGSRAEAFITNPIAALGEDAAQVIDPDQFDQAREEAGLLFERFIAHIERDSMGYPIKVGLLIEQANSHDPTTSEVHIFANDDELDAFIRLVRERLAEGMQLCGWQGFDFELLGDTPLELKLLEKAFAERRNPRRLVSYLDIYDLTRYAERVEQIGVDKPYYSPFISKKNDDEGWFPENMAPVIAWTPEGSAEPIAVPLTDDLAEQIKSKIVEAKAAGRDEITLGGFDKPLPVREAEFILGAFKEAFSDAERGKFDPASPARSEATSRRPRRSLVIRANIHAIDYEEARQDILTAFPGQPTLPMSLKPEVELKAHQRSGIAWLQHLFDKAPSYCRGAVLADDMGLGKTLQVLTLIAAAGETNRDMAPALVVAPVSLLENWQEEIERFFVKDAIPILTAYGDALAHLRVPRANIDEQLQSEGLIKFLKPGWRGNAKIVLTTYETLRDLEFSFGAEKWSIMVCDEAQKIKNPNALVTRAAKKQNVQFKVACTGTPVENTLADLWCLFDFVQPGLLGALNDFGQRYRKPIEAETQEEKTRVEELRTKIRPQILRRTKKEVATDLKDKIVVEDCTRLPLSAHQRMLYGQAIELFSRRNDPNVVTPFKNHLSLLHYLRLICIDPRRYGLSEFRADPLQEYRKRAPKLDWLLLKLAEIRERGNGGEKVIIFCEFRAIQRLLRHYIEETFGYVPDIINGDTPASASHAASRQKRIKAFQANPGFGVIILSPFAVGFGVNIQAANHVIHYTRTWNPAKEDQATDRAYRIGQSKDVYVYCPVIRADDFVTFDEKLDKLLQYKRELANDMLNGSGDVGPNDFDLKDMAPKSASTAPDRYLTLDDILRMRSDYFECLIAVLWQRKGFRSVYRTSESYDDGVDVVAIGSESELVQCKSSTVDNTTLSWDAIKDVIAGEASYRARHPGVEFRKICITNQFFNDNAHRHAALNNVTLYDQLALAKLIELYPVTLLDIERLLFVRWDGAA